MADYVPNPYDTYDPPSAEPSGKTCDFCGCEIYIGDNYYDFSDKITCEDCLYEYAKEYKLTAEEPEPDYD